MAEQIKLDAEYKDYNYIINHVGGALRSNHYSFDLKIPQRVITMMNRNRGGNLKPFTAKDINEMLEYFCTSITLQAIPSVESRSVQNYVELRNFINGVKYESISAMFYADVNGDIYNFFRAWKDCMYSMDYKIGGWYDDYISPEMRVRVTQEYSHLQQGANKIGFRNAREVITVVAQEVFPNTIETLQINGEAVQNLLVQVQFTPKSVVCYPSDHAYDNRNRNVFVNKVPNIVNADLNGGKVLKQAEAPKAQTPAQTSGTWGRVKLEDGSFVEMYVSWEQVNWDDETGNPEYEANVSVDGINFVSTGMSVTMSPEQIGTEGMPTVDIVKFPEENDDARNIVLSVSEKVQGEKPNIGEGDISTEAGSDSKVEESPDDPNPEQGTEVVTPPNENREDEIPGQIIGDGDGSGGSTPTPEHQTIMAATKNVD